MNTFVDMNMKLKEPTITTTWLSGSKGYRQSVVMVIPAEFTKDYSLDKPTHVLVTPTDNGLLIKKLEIVK
jgi:hypothetical protein